MLPTNQPTCENQRRIFANQPRQQMYLSHLEPRNANQHELRPSGNAWCTFALGLMENVESTCTNAFQRMPSCLEILSFCNAGKCILRTRITDRMCSKSIASENHQKTSSPCVVVMDESKPQVTVIYRNVATVPPHKTESQISGESNQAKLRYPMNIESQYKSSVGLLVVAHESVQ